jgi:hypothetical protein
MNETYTKKEKGHSLRFIYADVEILAARLLIILNMARLSNNILPIPYGIVFFSYLVKLQKKKIAYL